VTISDRGFNQTRQSPARQLPSLGNDNFIAFQFTSSVKISASLFALWLHSN